MPTPRERLEQLITNHVPSEVVFRLGKTQPDDALVLESVITKERSWTGDGSDDELRLALIDNIEENWDSSNGRYYINSSTGRLWDAIKHTILREYEKHSERCAATKRKTEQFIRSISIDDKHLPNYLITVFLVMSSPSYENKSRLECEAICEQFESLRRTYGKRHR